MTEMTLFDPDDFTAPGATPRAEKGVKRLPPPSDTFAVLAGQPWKLIAKSQPGVVHAHKGSSKTGGITAMGTYCGLFGVPRTFAPGEMVQGCTTCLAMGAPSSSLVA